MKQITFSQSQWDLLLAALARVKVHTFNQWTDWRDNKVSILIAGMEEAGYETEKQRRYHKYQELTNLMLFAVTNARDIEEDKA